MFGLDWTHLGGIGLVAAGAIGLLWSNRDKLTGLLPSFTSTATPPDDDTADFQALTRIQHRFARLKCLEGQAAVQTCMTHFFHGIEGQP